MEPHEELSFLLGGVRSLLEQLVDSGADYIPGDGKTRPRVLPSADPPREHHEPPREAAPMPREPAPMPREAPAPKPAPRAQPAPAPAPSRSLPTVQALDPEATKLRLSQIAEIVSGCTRCDLSQSRTQTVFARGNPQAELMFVGEGPGQDEDAQGLPFVGKAGQLLDKMIEAMGYKPDDVYIANIVKCRPPNNRKPEPQEMASCVGYLHEQIALVRPRAIVALGATACEGLLGVSGITRLRGTWRLYRAEIPVMPTFHPAYLLRTPEAKREVWADLKQVMQKLGKTPQRPG